jgi:hypothetical protein
MKCLASGNRLRVSARPFNSRSPKTTSYFLPFVIGYLSSEYGYRIIDRMISVEEAKKGK